MCSRLQTYCQSGVLILKYIVHIISQLLKRLNYTLNIICINRIINKNVKMYLEGKWIQKINKIKGNSTLKLGIRRYNKNKGIKCDNKIQWYFVCIKVKIKRGTVKSCGGVEQRKLYCRVECSSLAEVQGEVEYFW